MAANLDLLIENDASGAWNMNICFRAHRAELLKVLKPVAPEAWEPTATVSVPPNKTYERSTLFYGDWMAP